MGRILEFAHYPTRRLQNPATVGWNLATGLYYKTQPDPAWKLASARPGVAYIGLVYKLLPRGVGNERLREPPRYQRPPAPAPSAGKKYAVRDPNVSV